jgi:hypothetical protein
MTKVKRSEFRTFLNTTPDSTATYSLIGEGVSSGEVSYNPETSEDVYIHEDSGNAEVESYKPSMAIEATAVNGDEVFEFIDQLRKDRAVLADAHTDIVNVWLYETPTDDSYPAEKQDVAIAIESFGGEGGQASKINYTIYFRGDPVKGMYDTVLGTFTPDS